MKSIAPIAIKAIYWVSTLLFSAMMVASAAGYLTSEYFANAFTHLGFPAYFRVELAIAKFLGVAVLLAPFPRWLKEWAYAGFVITVVSAFIAHTAVDGVQTGIPALVALGILLLSYTFQSRMHPGTERVAGGHPIATR
jgi:hypothetical protein